MYLKAANPCSSVLFASHSLFGFLSSTCCGCLPFMFYLLLGLYSLFVTVGNGSNEQIPKVLFMLMCIIVFGILTMDKGTCKELTVLKNDPKPQSLNVGLAGEEWQEQIDLGLSKSLQYTSNQTKLTYHSGLALKRIKEVAAFLEHSHFSCWGKGEIWNQICSLPSSEQLAPSSQHVDVCVCGFI